MFGKDEEKGGFVLEDETPDSISGIVEAWSYALVHGFFDAQSYLKSRLPCKFSAIFVVPVRSGLYCASKGGFADCYIGTATSFDKVSCKSESSWEVLPIVSHTPWSGEDEIVICASSNVWDVVSPEEAFHLCTRSNISKPSQAIMILAADRGSKDAIVLVIKVPKATDWPADKELFRNQNVREKNLFPYLRSRGAFA